MTADVLQYDIVIVGAGPAGLAAAIRCKQLAVQQQQDCRVAIFEKGAEVGAHILSGAVLECRALNELLPDWQNLSPPRMTDVSDDRFVYLTKRQAWSLPTLKSMHNQGNKIVSLGEVCVWLSQIAESMGVDIFPGFAVQEILYDNDRVIGIKTGDNGSDKNGKPGSRFEPGFVVNAKYTLLAEGCRGHCSEAVIKRFNLREHSQPQTYALGIKELWQIPADQHQLGLVMHSVGWPLDSKTYGGSFVYHLDDNRVALGLVVGLDYQNPYLNPYAECQKLKTHPILEKMLAGGERIGYGARALNEGGWQSIPKLNFPGGAVIGCAAGFMNVPKIKGTHTAMKSGMLAAESVFQALIEQSDAPVAAYTATVKQSWIGAELYRARNIRPAFHQHIWWGMFYSALDQFILRGRAPWTFKHHFDHDQLKPAGQCIRPEYPKADGSLTFDKLTSVALTNVRHREDEPCHLQLRDPALAIEYNFEQFNSPEQYYCPAQVYEITYTGDGQSPRLQINAANCIHCKACDIKDPLQNIHWTAPEGGEGPRYRGM